MIIALNPFPSQPTFPGVPQPISWACHLLHGDYSLVEDFPISVLVSSSLVSGIKIQVCWFLLLLNFSPHLSSES